MNPADFLRLLETRLQPAGVPFSRHAGSDAEGILAAG